MEKLIYVVWKHDGAPPQRFRQEMLGGTARQLIALGARGLAVSLIDELTLPGTRITQMAEPMVGMVSIWLDTTLRRGPLEAALVRVTKRLAGYLVVESVPIVNTKHVVSPGERLPGLYSVAFLEKPSFLTYDAWLELWQGHHTQVAIETQSTFLYVQNVVVRALTKEAPPWAAIVEEAFPAKAAMEPMVFYNADSPQKLAENKQRMMESCEKFIDFTRLESHPMSAYSIKLMMNAE
ncbi:MAG: hypothetical protein ABSA52_07140 [Candidatus Binatia bacterium]|jgi:hypothetical protein